VEREKVTIETPELDPSLIFEQDPVQILDALLPLYMNSCLLRSLQVRARAPAWSLPRFLVCACAAAAGSCLAGSSHAVCV
jgi:hypothetical protein